MKRGGFLKRRAPLRSTSASTTSGLKSRGLKGLANRRATETNDIKDEIQAVARDIVIARDGGCILRDHPDVSPCNGYAKDGHLILQADHLVTRSNSATYSDTRLIVCVCKGHHGWKSVGRNIHKARYDAVVRTLLSPERIALWDRAQADRYKPTRKYTNDWKLELAALKQELAAYSSLT